MFVVCLIFSGRYVICTQIENIYQRYILYYWFWLSRSTGIDKITRFFDLVVKISWKDDYFPCNINFGSSLNCCQNRTATFLACSALATTTSLSINKKLYSILLLNEEITPLRRSVALMFVCTKFSYKKYLNIVRLHYNDKNEKNLYFYCNAHFVNK